ncbi:histidine phosphatase family protein [Candidatus Woesearchaeota archaeon]|nr:histidine phosphatase family protein [Candidatus Woesearchaeota archaeon]
MKVAPYGYGNGKKKAELRYYASLAAQHISPPLLPDSEEYILKHVKRYDLKNVRLILSSPQKRALQTAGMIRRLFLNNAHVKVDANLNEVPFSLYGLDSRKYSSTIARNKFFDDFVNNRLLESRDYLKSRVERILRKAKDTDTLFVTHTFLMKILEKLIECPDLFKHPQKFIRNVNLNKRLFEYCEILKLTNREIKQTLNKLG